MTYVQVHSHIHARQQPGGGSSGGSSGSSPGRQGNAHARRTRALQRRGLADGRDLQALHAAARVVAVLLAEPRVYHILQKKEKGCVLDD